MKQEQAGTSAALPTYGSWREPCGCIYRFTDDGPVPQKVCPEHLDDMRVYNPSLVPDDQREV